MINKEMNQSTGMVAEFHRTFNHPIAENVGDETLEVRQLRIKLLFEELQELAEATGCERTFHEICYHKVDANEEFWAIGGDTIDSDQVDHIAELDALCDLQYVLDGKILTSGHWRHFNQAFSEVQRSNMSKACDTEEEASMKIYELTNKGINVHKELHNGKWILVREDKKVLKGPHFKEPDLERFVKESPDNESNI